MVGDIVADGEETAAQRLRVFETEVLTAAEMRAGFGDVFAEAVACGDLDHASQAQRRKEFGEAIEVLLAAAFGGVRRGVGIAAEAAVFGPGRKSATVAKFVRFAFDLGFGAGEGERVDGGVGIAELVEGFGEIDVATLVKRFARAEEWRGGRWAAVRAAASRRRT